MLVCWRLSNFDDLISRVSWLQQAESEEVAKLKAIIRRLQGGGGGAAVAGLDLIEAAEPVVETGAAAIDADDNSPDFDYAVLEN